MPSRAYNNRVVVSGETQRGFEMAKMDRRTFITGLGAAVTLAPGLTLRASAATGGANPDLTKINPKFLISPKDAHALHLVKDSHGGPTLAGTPSWKNYIELLEAELRKAGVVDVFRNPFTYTRWYTSEWPDDSNWSLHVDGTKVKVANYGCNSGKTPDDGVTGSLVVYKAGMPAESLRGKIAIVEKTAVEDPLASAAGGRTGDYEYLSNPETFPDAAFPAKPQGEICNPFGLMGLGRADQELTAGGAMGALIVLPMSYDALSGVYTFAVPKLHEMPSLYLDRDAGAQMKEAAAAGKSARLRLVSKTEEVEAHQLFGYLPGRDYGKPEDKMVLLVTHTDGPSISQENGGLGILSMVKYFSHIPQAERPRSLMIFYDCRHYLPGMERAFVPQDYASSHPDVYKSVIAAMGIEHLGQIQVVEESGKPYHRTNLAELSSVWTTNNQHLVDLAIKAVKDNQIPRVQVECPGRPGIHGGEQGPWYGLGNIARRIGVPGASTMGSMSAYWSTKARINYLDPHHFVRQVAAMSQICGELMLADLDTIKSAPAAAPKA